MKILTLAYSCVAAQPVTLGTVSGNNPLVYTHYSYMYTANRTFPTLSFGFSAPSGILIFLDDVSVTDTNSSIQLLNNPTFNASSTAPSGWDVWCSNTCGSGSVGTIVSGNGTCRTDNCYRSQCTTSNTEYLVQTFPAVIGRTYNISFWVQRTKTCCPGTATLYVGIM